ncbi:cyclase family protein [Nocardia sp. SSK8]|uniref:cyclase family protein n=1 Tax=Nocardia sp. SSK8 TaxID=3120154 RepID=UPI00300BAD1D
MCSPEIVRHARDGAPRPNRRALFGLAGLAAAAAVVPAPASAAPRPGGVVDLTHTLTPRLPVWPGNPPFAMVPVAWHASGGFGQSALGFWEHTGTHLDAPAHRIPGAATTETLPPGDLVAPLVVLDISAKAAADADAVVTVADLDAWRARHGEIPDRAFVAMYSGWERRLADPSTFLNLDGGGRPHAPGFSGEAADYLVTQCGIVGAGVDTLSLDCGADTDYGAHTALLGAGRYGVEMLAALDAVPPVGATVVVGAPKHAGGTGGPCRVLALT